MRRDRAGPDPATARGSKTIRQNSLFKDFYLLAEHETHKKKVMYLLETPRPLKRSEACEEGAQSRPAARVRRQGGFVEGLVRDGRR